MISLTFLAIRCGFSLVSFIIFMLIFWCILKEWMYTYFLNYLLPERNIHEFDYIVVGSGSAGSIVALRLAENTNNTVLVLEAGVYAGILFDIPTLTPLLQKSLVDWHYNTVPQKHSSWALKNNVSNWPMGNIYGGTSRLNSMIYARGHPSDFKSWFKDDSNYLYEEHILPYFMKAEDQRGRYKSSQLHSTGGPLAVDDLSFITSFTQHFLEAVTLLNFSVHDLNGEENIGFMKVQTNIKSGSRWSPAHHLFYLKNNNVTIKTNAFVEKILFRGNYEAYGVRYSHFGNKFIARARKGIVLSAGVIGSPKLLMLSGIGPKDHLEKIKVPLVIDLPVGDNLQDHITTGLDLIVLNKSIGLSLSDFLSPMSAFEYLFHKKGPWTSIGCEVIGIVDTKGNGVPDLEIMVLPTGITADFGAHLRYALNLKDSAWMQYFELFQDKTTISIIPVVLHPKSRGTVRLQDNNPYSKPLIDPNYLSEPYDVEILLRGIELIKKIIGTEPLSKLGAKLNDKKFPGCKNYTFDSRSYWECYIRHFTLTSYHPVGTCSLGGKNEKGVVNYDFKVRNTNKLFVVDASVLPTLPSANINAAVIMIAEKAADIIKLEDKLSSGKCTVLDLFLR